MYLTELLYDPVPMVLLADPSKMEKTVRTDLNADTGPDEIADLTASGFSARKT